MTPDYVNKTIKVRYVISVLFQHVCNFDYDYLDVSHVVRITISVNPVFKSCLWHGGNYILSSEVLGSPVQL